MTNKTFANPSRTCRRPTVLKRICALVTLVLTCLNFSAVAQAGYLEGDVYPFTTNGTLEGDGFVTFIDWEHIANMAIGLETPINSLQFSLADCAPRETLGDGSITTIDVVQCRRFSVGYDMVLPAPPTNGPTSPIAKQPLLGGPRKIFISNTNLVRGEEQTVNICLAGDGTENAVGFSLEFDPSALRLVAPTNWVSYEDFPGHGIPIAAVNATDATNGHFSAIAMALYFAPPTLLSITFQAIGSSDTVLHFSDTPTLREVSDTNAVALPATYEDAVIHFVNVPQLSNLSIVGNQFQCTVSGTNGQPVSIESSTNFVDWNVTAAFTLTNDIQEFRTAVDDGAKFYRIGTAP